MIDYIVVGSGLAGVVMAERIATQLNKKVLIIEKRNHIGGNCYDFKDENNILIHKYGPHLFHTNNKDVIDYLSKFTSWDIYNHEVLCFIDGKKVPIPFNFNTLYEVFPNQKAKALEAKLLETYDYNSKVPILELKKSTDKDLQCLADFIYEKIFVNYTAKQWGMKPEDMDGAVTARVPVFIGRDNRYFNDSYQMLPSNGYTSMINNMLNHKNIKIMLNTDFQEICTLKDKDFYLFDKKFDGKVIYTGQIDELFDYKFGDLPYRSVNMQFETIEKDFYQEKATINYPNDYDFTRITEFKHIHPINTPKTTILKEYPQEYVRNKNTPYYPIFTNENQNKYNQYLEYSKKFENLILVGRLAEYKYYDMDDIVKKALEVFEETFK
ncbi:UDP-galactopyranose mutase [Aliarcobacter cryaerophilus]|uniref:UDP-galactopyranose mutase n=2 Tax=unclassified Arcobacter TaxID=2593671 RepID=A0AA96CP54_9BACT|nr:UDP-galactopyranose mutase [Arcobacter sp. AZ-2023]WPD09095.1 UDP-galactopyranose mutase [Arcobacter sp. DSM 115954]WNL13927.1 UDP-galactopyranose mutase [Arcobacter sp. AZ-2023]WNL18067.1 UDP-galactopyranose mutase [Arcobacter sp. AZ-2023]WNL22335.1 UDP-galactopyranose mutase [Arcobacter sp. AZ-2023]